MIEPLPEYGASAHDASPASIRSLSVKVLAVALAAVLGAVDAQAVQRPDNSQRQSVAGPQSPERERASFQLPNDLAIELVAAEPEVYNPVAVAWDGLGQMYTVEMTDYPTGPPGGRIKLLVDRDGDGRIDSSTVFADGLAYPTSVLPWRGGVLVSTAPDIKYLRDTDGDGRADSSTVLYTGFAEGNQQLRVNGLLLGIDHWIYAANGRSDGEVHRVDWPFSAADSKSAAASVSIRHRDFRFNSVDGRFEATSSFTQHGHGFDDWGNLFIGWNTVHIRHVVLDQQYLDRNPLAPPITTVEEIADPDHGSTCRVFPVSRTTQRFNAEPPGYMNASCGLTVYRGDWLPEPYRGNAFVCEPLSNLVHRDLLEPDGATFVARRAPSERDCEFLASTDPWFRPVNVCTGPDGALYVVDFYRALVEHPQYVRDEVARKTVNWREGSDRGRIWRITPKDSKPRETVRPAMMSDSELVPLLQHANSWQRDTAQRLLIERSAKTVGPALVELATPDAAAIAKSGIAADRAAVTRIHAIRTLDALRLLDDATLFRTLTDPHPRVREHSVELAEPRLQDSRKLTGMVADLADDPDARVRFQVVCTLGNVPVPVDVRPTILEIARRDFADRWIRRAVINAASQSAAQYLVQFLTEIDPARAATDDQLDFAYQLAVMVGTSSDEADDLAVIAALAKIPAAAGVSWPLTGWAGLADGLQRSGRTVEAWRQSHTEALKRACDDVERMTPIADAQVRTETAHAAVRRMAVRLLAHTTFKRAESALRFALGDLSDQGVRLAAVQAYSSQSDPSVTDSLLAEWPTATPVVRSNILDALLSRRDRIPQVLAAVESGRLTATDLGPAHSESLLRLVDDATRARLQTALGKGSSSDRAALIASYRESLQLMGNAPRGAELFVKHCSSCHAIQGKGHRVGPDLASVASHSRDQNMADILDPNRSVASDFVSYIVAGRDGRIVTGVIVAETSGSITLRRLEGVDETIARREIEELKSTGKSLMPEGLEQVLSRQEMADLLEFLGRGEPPER